ncbi:hypothetical protein ACHAWO_013118, partial [Cyclotella atomus]
REHGNISITKGRVQRLRGLRTKSSLYKVIVAFYTSSAPLGSFCQQSYLASRLLGTRWYLKGFEF